MKNRLIIEDIFWKLMGGILAVLSLALVSWIGDFNYPDERGTSALVVFLVYTLWFIAGAITMKNFLKHIRGGK